MIRNGRIDSSNKVSGSVAILGIPCNRTNSQLTMCNDLETGRISGRVIQPQFN